MNKKTIISASPGWFLCEFDPSGEFATFRKAPIVAWAVDEEVRFEDRTIRRAIPITTLMAAAVTWENCLILDPSGDFTDCDYLWGIRESEAIDYCYDRLDQQASERLTVVTDGGA